MTAVDHEPTGGRLAVFISGGGRTLRNIQAAIESGELPAEVVLVAASRECPGAEWARSLVRTEIVPRGASPDDIDRLVAGAGADWIVLAGYTRLLPIPPRYRGRVVNIHPALLPAFGGPGMYGERVHRAVLDARTAESGCTVHLCDDAYDTGPILDQLRCPVLPDDTPASLGARVFELEKRLYPRVLADLVSGRIRVAPEPGGPGLRIIRS